MSMDKRIFIDEMIGGRKLVSIPAFLEFTQTHNANLLLHQVYFWWTVQGKRKFYKFINIPEKAHGLYRKGDSWLEEVCLGRAAFAAAINIIGTKVANVDEVPAALKSKQANHLVIYYTDRDNVTWWILNEELFYDLTSKALAKESKQREAIRQEKTELDRRYEDWKAAETASSENLKPLNTENTTETTRYLHEADASAQVRTFGAKKPKPKAKRKLSKQGLFTKIRDRQQGEVMSLDFSLDFGILDRATELGYEVDDVGREFEAFKFYYTKGKGIKDKAVDWKENFVVNWLNNQYSYGKIRKNGQFYKSDANTERLESLQRKHSTDIFAGSEHKSLEQLLREARGKS